MIVEHIIIFVRNTLCFIEHIIDFLVNDLKISKDEIHPIRYHFADV